MVTECVWVFALLATSEREDNLLELAAWAGILCPRTRLGKIFPRPLALDITCHFVHLLSFSTFWCFFVAQYSHTPCTCVFTYLAQQPPECKIMITNLYLLFPHSFLLAVCPLFSLTFHMLYCYNNPFPEFDAKHSYTLTTKLTFTNSNVVRNLSFWWFAVVFVTIQYLCKMYRKHPTNIFHFTVDLL